MRHCLILAGEAIGRGDALVGCLIVRGGQVVAEALERVIADPDPTVRAELRAVRQACRGLGMTNLWGMLTKECRALHLPRGPC